MFPRLTRAFFSEVGVAAEIVEVSGAVEITPRLGVADCIVDLVATGSTLRANQLREVATVLESSARLVSRPTAEDPPELLERLDELVVALGSVVQGALAALPDGERPAHPARRGARRSSRGSAAPTSSSCSTAAS